MHVIRTDGNLLQYNDVADQFVVVWTGIVAVMVNVKHYYFHIHKLGEQKSLCPISCHIPTKYKNHALHTS